jgi:hypothetical protein
LPGALFPKTRFIPDERQQGEHGGRVSGVVAHGPGKVAPALKHGQTFVKRHSQNGDRTPKIKSPVPVFARLGGGDENLAAFN